MKRIRLTVAYDGTAYHGWQIQNNGETIESVLNRELSALLKEEIAVQGASRTDAGVHALGNVAVFDTDSRIPAEKISYALNQRLPEDIRIQRSEEVDAGFHPRKVNGRKTYEYRILNREFELPSLRLYSYFFHRRLNVDAMRQAAACLVGEHDFQSFCSVHTQAEDTVRTLYEVSVGQEGDCIILRVVGNGFLYNMVRIIAGTLLQVGIGKISPYDLPGILAARDRKAAGPTAPACGLTLVSLEYETALEPETNVENADWSYRLWQETISERGQAFVWIHRCREEDFAGLVDRLALRSFRNGAREVFFLDEEKGRILGEAVPEQEKLPEAGAWFVRHEISEISGKNT